MCEKICNECKYFKPYDQYSFEGTCELYDDEVDRTDMCEEFELKED